VCVGGRGETLQCRPPCGTAPSARARRQRVFARPHRVDRRTSSPTKCELSTNGSNATTSSRKGRSSPNPECGPWASVGGWALQRAPRGCRWGLTAPWPTRSCRGAAVRRNRSHREAIAPGPASRRPPAALVSRFRRTISTRKRLTVEELDRWVKFGATWRVVEISDRYVIVDMCQCTGELVQQRDSSDPVVLDYLRTHPRADGVTSSEDGAVMRPWRWS
jgi:hypothetical protein